MNIGSTDATTPADIAADFAERVRSAHETAAGDRTEQSREVGAAGSDREVDEVGAELRATFESIVADVVDPARSEPDDLLGRAVEALVDDRIERGNLPADDAYRDRAVDQMRNDPVVVSELDDIMQSIARDLAVRD